MALTTRNVLPETLDELPPEDARAIRSRRDLQRIHRVMRTVSIIEAALQRLQLAAPPRRILELGAGDGTLMLRVARAMHRAWPRVALTLLDNHDIVAPRTRAAFAALGWDLTVLRQDALCWADAAAPVHHDLCFANLFLHHFDGMALSRLINAIAMHSDALIACEPRRNAAALLAGRLTPLLAASVVTRQDAVTSVRAGFSGQELSALWPSQPRSWFREEYLALPFTHCFIAVAATSRGAVAR